MPDKGANAGRRAGVQLTEGFGLLVPERGELNMKMQEAMEIMEDVPKPAGFMVHFEWAGDGFLRSDHFPDVCAGESPIATEEEAWQMAAQFAAKKRKRCVNVYVIRRENFTPVQGYRERMIENR